MARLPTLIDDLIELHECLDDGRLACPHCGSLAKPQSVYSATACSRRPVDAVSMLAPEPHPRYRLLVIICAGCDREILHVSRLAFGQETEGWTRKAYPIGRAKKQYPNSPAQHVKPYEEACAVLELSPSASACMSRRCLQGVLRDQGYHQKDLAKQIDALLAETAPNRALPPALREVVDVIRNFGNFGAHPINDVTTLQIIEVEEGEADWCIDVAEKLLDHFFEQPAIAKARITAINAKLKAGGKPPVKS